MQKFSGFILSGKCLRHVTNEMPQSAAAKIDRAIAKAELQLELGAPKKPVRTVLQAVRGKYRKLGTGCVTQISDHLWEGRYSPKWIDGKKHARNIYAPTEAEYEEKLAQLIVQMKKEPATKQFTGIPKKTRCVYRAFLLQLYVSPCTCSLLAFHDTDRLGENTSHLE